MANSCVILLQYNIHVDCSFFESIYLIRMFSKCASCPITVLIISPSARGVIRLKYRNSVRTTLKQIGNYFPWDSLIWTILCRRGTPPPPHFQNFIKSFREERKVPNTEYIHPLLSNYDLVHLNPKRATSQEMPNSMKQAVK